jgi:anhydro-N-acetylmuramic acid kinase
MKKPSPKEMLVMGMMSGTSADGIEAAIVRICGSPPTILAELESHHHVPFGPHVREQILRLANGGATTTAEISRLDFVIGEEFGRAAIEASKRAGIPLSKIDLIGSHGQTVFHQGAPARLVGAWRVASTLQIGEPSIIAERTGVPTIADFRPSDIAAGGQGAPLVPFVDYLLYRDAKRGRVALNIGGISNVTVIPAAANPEDIFAFDTGPGNMIVDALIQGMTQGHAKYDRGAKTALTGRTIPELLSRMMREPYLRKRPPKTAGREQFGQAYVERLIRWGKNHHASPADLARTATVFTSLSIADAFRRLILPRASIQELIVSGGGARNPLMMAQLAASVPGIEIIQSSQLGVATDAKEAFAFAILAYESYHGRPNNLPSATGARHPVVMGKLSCGRPK